MLSLPYGRAPLRLDLGSREFTILELPVAPPPPALGGLVDAALDYPIASARLEQRVVAGDRITVIVSDRTRSEPRGLFLEHLRSRLPSARWTLAIATGTHGPCGVDALGIPPALTADMTIVDHDGHRDDDLVVLGTTARGTVARVHRCLVDADLVIATGCIRPHYFAGFGAGTKAMFPGLGAARDVRHNHTLKTLPRSRAGIVDDNPCRADLVEAAALVPTPAFLLDGVCASDGSIQAVVAGDPQAAFRRGVELARPWFEVDAEPADVVIASDVLPVTATVYQAAKIAAAVAPLVREDGILVVAAECPEGIGPGSESAALDVVNEAILRIGVLPRLRSGVRLALISGLDPGTVRRTLFAPFASIEDAVADTSGSVLVVPRASQILIRLAS